jgi:hypothetical protein
MHPSVLNINCPFCRKPATENPVPEKFFNGKGYYSINMMYVFGRSPWGVLVFLLGVMLVRLTLRKYLEYHLLGQ